MKTTMKPAQDFTKYEIARICGARALQIAMDAPILLKLTKEELEEMKYDALRIAEKEFSEGVLPISIHRPLPKRRAGKLQEVKEEQIDDERIIAKEKEIEQEINEKAVEEGFVQEDEQDTVTEETSSEEEM